MHFLSRFTPTKIGFIESSWYIFRTGSAVTENKKNAPLASLACASLGTNPPTRHRYPSSNTEPHLFHIPKAKPGCISFQVDLYIRQPSQTVRTYQRGPEKIRDPIYAWNPIGPDVAGTLYHKETGAFRCLGSCSQDQSSKRSFN